MKQCVRAVYERSPWGALLCRACARMGLGCGRGLPSRVRGGTRRDLDRGDTDPGEMFLYTPS